MTKRQKRLRIALAAGVLLLFNLVYQFLPMIFKVEWIMGWPQFIGQTLPYLINSILAYFMLKPLFSHLKKSTQDQKLLAFVAITIMAVVILGFNAWGSFVNRWQTVDRYIDSPNHKHRAVVMTDTKDHIIKSDNIYPVRARWFYESDNVVYVHPSDENTFNWIDDNTLEIIRVRESTGEVSTDYFRW